MSLIDNQGEPLFDWRPGMKARELAGRSRGATDLTLYYNELDRGATTPLHQHTTDEVILVAEGALEVRQGDETLTAGADHTWHIPAGIPHGFTVKEHARMYIFFPMVDPFAEGKTTYLEGDPPTVPG